MFQLKDILNDKVPGYFYREELTKSEPLSFEKNYFFVEKILKTKYVKKEKWCLVKYLFYGNKVKYNLIFSNIVDEITCVEPNSILLQYIKLYFGDTIV